MNNELCKMLFTSSEPIVAARYLDFFKFEAPAVLCEH